MIAAPAIDERAVIAALVNRIMAERGEGLQLLTTHQLCGLLNIEQRSLEKLPIPRTTLKVGTYRYRLTDVAKFIESRTV